MQAWQYPYPVKTATLPNQMKIAYVDEGAGPYTLLFLHGMGSNLQAWKKNIDALRHSYRCIALDLPGYGKSSQESYPFSMSFFTESVLAFIDRLQLKNVVLVGHSMGGQITMAAAIKRPGLLSKLILVAPAGFETFSKTEKAWFNATMRPEILKAMPVAQIVRNFEINFYKFPDDARFMINDRLLMRKSAAAYDHYCRMIPKCIKGMLGEPIFSRLPEIKLPCLLFFGEEDELIPNRFIHSGLRPEDVARAGCRALPNCQLQMLPQAGHFAQWDQAYLVNSSIYSFLKSG